MIDSGTARTPKRLGSIGCATPPITSSPVPASAMITNEGGSLRQNRRATPITA